MTDASDQIMHTDSARPTDRDVIRATLKVKIRQAERRRAQAEKAVAELTDQLDELNELDTLDVIRSWRGKPDWSYLLVGDRSTSSYMLCRFMVERLGLRVGGGIRSDTGQNVLCIAIARTSDPKRNAEHIARIRDGMSELAPHILQGDEGFIQFSIRGENIDYDSCAMGLSVARTLEGVAHIVSYCHGHENNRESFSSLGEAMLEIQERYPSPYDPFEEVSRVDEHNGYSGYWLLEAIKAYVEGCRSAGVAVPDFACSKC